MSTHPLQERATRFVGALRLLQKKQDRGSLAALRRGFSPATVMDAWPVVHRLDGEIGLPGESVYVDIAALFAEHPVESTARNFGDTCRAVATDDKGVLIDSHERRFRRLLASDSPTDLAGQLRAWIRLAGKPGKVVGVNYEALFLDMRFWSGSAQKTRVEWARSFWRSGEESSSATAPTDSTATTETSLPAQT